MFLAGICDTFSNFCLVSVLYFEYHPEQTHDENAQRILDTSFPEIDFLIQERPKGIKLIGAHRKPQTAWLVIGENDSTLQYLQLQHFAQYCRDRDITIGGVTDVSYEPNLTDTTIEENAQELRFNFKAVRLAAKLHQSRLNTPNFQKELPAFIFVQRKLLPEQA